jgi:hypothetical protein
MVASSHPPLTDVMTERPCELLHMDLVGPAHVRSTGGKWYILIVVDEYSRYAWVFLLEEKGETFGFVRDLVLRLKNERHEMPYEQSTVTMAQNSETLVLKSFAMTWVLNTSFRVRIGLPQNGVVERKNKTLCEMARTMLDKHRTPRRFWAEAVNTAMFRTGSTSECLRRKPATS